MADYGTHIDHGKHEVSYVTVPKQVPRIPAEARFVRTVDDINDQELVIEAATEAHDACGPFDRLLALSEFDLLVAARIRERFDIPGLGTESVMLFRDKTRMKARVAAAGLRIPRFQEVSTIAEIAAFRARLGTDVVVKPRTGAASIGTFVVSSGDDLSELLGQVDLTGYEVEEFLDGPVWHLDGMMLDESMAFGRASRYMDTCYGFAQGRSLGSAVQTGPEARELLAFAEACLCALGLSDGPFHFELIQTPTGPAFLEVGARIGGGEIPWVLRDVYRVDLIGDTIRLELGERPVTVPKEGDGDADREHGGFLLIPEAHGKRLVSRSSMVGAVPTLYAEALPAPGHVFDGKGGYNRILGRFRYRGPSAAAVEEAIVATQAQYEYVLEQLPDEFATDAPAADGLK